MKKLLLYFLFYCFFFISFTLLEAQMLQLTSGRNLTISGGYTQSWVDGQYTKQFEYKSSTSSVEGLLIDVSYLTINSSDLFRLEKGLRYINRGFDYRGEFDGYDSDDNPYLYKASVKQELDYLDFYVNYVPELNYTDDFPIRYYPFFGVGASYLLRAKDYWHIYEPEQQNYSINNHNFYYRFNFIIQLGTELTFYDFISLKAEYNRSLNYIMKFDEWSNNKAFINSFLVSLGLKI